MKNKKVGILMISLGVIAILIAGGLWLSNYLEEMTAAEYSDNVSVTFLEIITLEAPPIQEAPSGDALFNAPDDSEEPADDETLRYIIIGEAAYLGVLHIPTLDLSVPINAGWSYPALRRTPCRFSGSIDGNTLVVAGHNYRGHFANISRLALGEPITLTDVDGIVHDYEVVDIIIVAPDRGYEVRHSEYDLTLFTCTSDSKARTVVRCMRVATVEDGEEIIDVQPY